MPRFKLEMQRFFGVTCKNVPMIYILCENVKSLVFYLPKSPLFSMLCVWLG